ncbi:MAG TPA: alkaline phosphatase [Colwellia sp.]|nr:alkaline phosphatase [Colwellia sp.]|tara:strand:- start:6327 stop:8174 length:1848 start_codon:yes stop_codon:yes gene_type:complete
MFSNNNYKVGVLALALSMALTGCVSDGDDGEQGTPGVVGSDGIDGKSLPRALNVEVVGRFATGIYGKSAAEIVQFHKISNSVFAINGAANQIEVISLANLSTTQVGNPIADESLASNAFTFPLNVSVTKSAGVQIDIPLGAVNSIAIKQDLLAIAVEGEVKQANGAILFYNLNKLGEGTFIRAVEVGALPDMVTFTPDGSKALVANEGEPSTDYTNDPEGSISVISIVDSIPANVAKTINLSTDIVFSDDNLAPEDFDTDAKRLAILSKAGVKFAGPSGNTVAKDLEPEYITTSSNSKMAYVSLQENNAIGIINLEELTIEVKALGYKDWGKYQLDFSNKDEVPEFKNIQGLYGMYQPDTIASYTWNDSTFIVSANEGDAREYDGFSEEVRVKDIIDADELNQALSTELQIQYDESGGKNYLGRLKVTTALGDSDKNGEFEKLYAYGARSFSIWDKNVNLVFDSGDDFGKISSAILGDNFNAAHTKNKGDNRSDDKGGEPEAIDVGEIAGRTYAFIAQERAGDLFVYDITNPFNTAFVTHYNNRDFTVDYEMDDDLADPCDSSEGMDCTEVNKAGDLGPESIKFISATDSPTSKPLVIVGNEVSGTVTVYQVTEQ